VSDPSVPCVDRPPPCAATERSAAQRHAARRWSLTAAVAAVQAVAAAATVALWWVAARYWEPAQFALFLVARRALTLVQLPVVTVFQLALIRFGAEAWARRDGRRRGELLAAGTALAVGLAALVVVGLNLAARPAAALVLGGEQHAAVVRAGACSAAAFVLYSVAYSELCGRLAVVRSCLWQLAATTLAPLAGFLAPGLDVAHMLLLQAASVGSLAIWLLARSLRRDWQADCRPAGLLAAGVALARYGLPRVPGAVAAMLLLAAPAILAVARDGPLAGACFALGSSVLALVGGLLRPLTQLTVPLVSALAATGDRRAVRRHARRSLQAGGALAVGGAALAQLLVPWAPALLGPAYRDALPLLRILACGIAPYGMFVVLRDYLDACESRALNSRNLLLALAVLGVAGGVGVGGSALAWSFVAALTALAGLSWRDVRSAVWQTGAAQRGVGTRRAA